MKKRLTRVPALVLAGALAITAMPYGNLAVKAEETADMKNNQAVDADDIVVLYTNDVHNAYEHEVDKTTGKVSVLGYSSVAYVKNQVAATTKNLELVDCGDSIQGGVIGSLSKGSYLVDIMNQVGYTVAVPGNHEYDFGMAQFLNLAGKGDSSYTGTKAGYQYVSCNFMDLKTNKTVFDAYSMKTYTVDGAEVKVAYVGISTPESLTKSTPTYFQDADGNYIYSFCENTDGSALYKQVQDSVDAAKKAGADYVVAVAHTGIDETSAPYDTKSIIKNTTGIDVYLDGHSHSTIECENVANKAGKNVVLSSTGTKLAALGELVIDKSENTIKTSLITDVTKEDETTKTYVNSITEKFAALKNKVVAHSDVNLVVNDPNAVNSDATKTRIVRSQETNLGDLCADAYKDQMDADCAIVNGGGVRADVNSGDLTYGDIISVHPFGNAACLAEVTGQQILDCLEMGARAASANNDENGGFIQVSGITYVIDTTVASSVVVDDKKNFVSVNGEYRVKNVQINGEPIDLKKTYKLATHNYYLKSFGDGMTMFNGCNILVDEKMFDYEVLINYITDTLKGNVAKDSIYANPYGEGRIRVVTEHNTANSDYCAKVLQGTKQVTIGHEMILSSKQKKDGYTHFCCQFCGKEVKAKLSASEFTYTGKKIKPTVKVKNSKGKTLKASKVYDVVYSNNKKVGTATATINFKGKYLGSKALTYTINPVATKIKSVTAKKGGFKVKLAKKTSQVSGYQIKYSTSKTMKNASKITKDGKKNNCIKASGLKKGKTYYIKARTYKTVDGKKYYSEWTSISKVKTLKK